MFLRCWNLVLFFFYLLENEDEYDVKLLKQQSSSEESSESELDKVDVTRLENRYEDTLDCASDDGMTMNV